MKVSQSYWRQLSYQLLGNLPYTANKFDYIDNIARLLIQGRLKFFAINDLDRKLQTIGRRTFKQTDGKAYQFASPAEQLKDPNRKTKKIDSKKNAVKFAKGLGLEKDSLLDLASAFNLKLPISNTQNDTQEIILESIADAITEEKILIFEDMPNKPTAPKVEYEDVHIKSVTLGPETNANQTKATEKPELILQSIDPQFAPGVESLDMTYDIKLLESEAVFIEIKSSSYSSNTLYKRELSDAEKTTGTGKPLTWDGRINTGSLNGEWASPIHGPYIAALYVQGSSTLKSEKDFNIEIERIDLDVESDGDKLFINIPESDKLVKSSVLIKKKDGSGVNTPIELECVYTFTRGSGTVNETDSFEYDTGKRLGKENNAAAVYWKDHPDNDSSSTDTYKTKCKAKTITASNTDMGLAKIWFVPSGVGGNKYTLKSEIFAADGTTSLMEKESKELTIWREIEFSNIYSMDGQTYISSGTAEANVNPAFSPAFVKYTRGTVTNLDATLSVKYIGLYDKANGGSKSWPADFSPANLETSPNQLAPTATELADLAGSDATKSAAAKTAIETKAQDWFTAIVRDYSSCVSDWFSDASVPAGGNTLLAVQYYHPKLSGQPDGATSFWPAGISINMANPGSGMTTAGHPDSANWREVQGFNRGNIVVVFKNYGTSGRLQIICRHEIGHATKSEFKRDTFGTGDHSSSGLMTPYGSSNTFSLHDKKVLRGKTP